NLGTINLLRTFPRLSAGAGDTDSYRLTAGADGTLSIAVTGGGNLQVVVADSNGNNPTFGNPLRDADGQVIGQPVLRQVAANEVLLLKISGGNGTAYSITAQALTADLGTRVYDVENRNLPVGGQHVFAITAAVDGSVHVQLAGQATDGSMMVRLLGADG